MVFHNDSNYDYLLIIKELAKEFEEQFECLVEKEVIKIYKDGNESVITIYNLLIVQDLWQVHYEILLVISQKEFTRLNVKIVIVFLNMKMLRII